MSRPQKRPWSELIANSDGLDDFDPITGQDERSMRGSTDEEVRLTRERVRQRALSRETQLGRQNRLANFAKSSGQPSITSPLLRLPVTLRSLIFNYVITLVTDVEDEKESERCESDTKIHPVEALSQTCRAVRYHILFLYFSQTRMVVQIEDDDFEFYDFWSFIAFRGRDFSLVMPAVELLINTDGITPRQMRGIPRKLNFDLIDFGKRHERAFVHCRVTFQGTKLEISTDALATKGFRTMLEYRPMHWDDMKWAKSRRAIAFRSGLKLGNRECDEISSAAEFGRGEYTRFAHFTRRKNRYLGYASASRLTDAEENQREEGIVRKFAQVGIVWASTAVSRTPRRYRIIQVNAEEDFFAFRRRAGEALGAGSSNRIIISNLSRSNGSIVDEVAFVDFISEVFRTHTRPILFAESPVR